MASCIYRTDGKHGLAWTDTLQSGLARMVAAEVLQRLNEGRKRVAKKINRLVTSVKSPSCTVIATFTRVSSTRHAVREIQACRSMLHSSTDSPFSGARRWVYARADLALLAGVIIIRHVPYDEFGS